MVNNSSFGLAFWIKNIGGINNTTEIDSVSLTITYSIAVVAPVRFVSLVANKTTGGTELVWKVAAEENIERYEVEKSSDGNHFSTVGSRTAEGSAEYRYTQHSTFGDEGYYRIKALNRDGSKNYSTVVYAKNIGNNHALHVFPLPARSVITVVHEKASAGTKILLCNANGSVAKEIIPAINASETNINIAHLTPGIYFLQYATGNGAVESKRILKL
jgi:archaellum component FlaG (FlaF/FlaG flagellin family)